MPNIASRLAANVIYATYIKNTNNTYSVAKEIKIYGKADVSNKNTLITEKGANTTITNEELELLEQNSVFQIHKENGVVEICKNNEDCVKIIKDEILLKDFSAPLTNKDMGEVNVKEEKFNEEKDIDEIIKNNTKEETRERKTTKNK